MVEINKMRNIAALDRWIPIVNGWSEGLNNIIRCAEISELKCSVTPIEENIMGGGCREK